MKTPLTRVRLQEHWRYSWWKYLLLAALALGGWSIAMTVTAPRTPENKLLEVYFFAYGQEERVNNYLSGLQEREFPDQETVHSLWIPSDGADGVVVLSTRLMAGEAELTVLPREQFQSFANTGTFVALDQLPGVVNACEAAGLNVERAWRVEESSGERHLFGIPLQGLPFLRESIYNVGTANEYYLSIRVHNGNDANSARLLGLLLRELMTGAEGAEGLDELCAPVPAEEEAPAE